MFARIRHFKGLSKNHREKIAYRGLFLYKKFHAIPLGSNHNNGGSL